MALERQRRMVDLLLERTKVGKIDWKSTVNPDVFQVSFRDNTVQISTRVSARGDEPDFLITLLNSEGDVADVFSDVELLEDQGDLHPDERRSYFKVMGELYERARRTARGGEKIVNSILEELGDDEIPF